MHRLFRLGRDYSYGDLLTAPKLDEFAADLKGVKLIVIDEYSMCGLERLSAIDGRLK